MDLDIRMPIGALFSIFGVILAAYGFLSDPAIYQRSLGLNVNLIWGSVMLVTGAILLYFSSRAGAKQ